MILEKCTLKCYNVIINTITHVITHCKYLFLYETYFELCVSKDLLIFVFRDDLIIYLFTNLLNYIHKR